MASSEENPMQLTDIVVKPQKSILRPAPSYGSYERLKASDSPLSSPKLGRKAKNIPQSRSIAEAFVRKTSNALNSQRKLQEHETSDWIVYQAAVDGNVQQLKNHVEALKLKGLDVKHALNNALDSDGFSPLHLASRFNHEKLAVFLLANGASVDATANDGTVPLHIAIRYRSAEVALLLIQHGANLNKADTSGVTPLHLACNRAETGVVNSILGSDDSGVDSCDFRAMSPLHHAALSGDLGIIKVLIAHGANIFATNNRGETPLHLSSGENSIQAAKILIDTCNEKKEDASKYISIKREDGRSALDVASQMGHIEIMKLLHEEGKKDSESCPSAVPLHLAAISGHYEAVQLLLSFGIPVNARNKERRTALHEAASSERLNVMELLIEKGAEVDPKDKYKFTPLFRAVVKGKTKAVRLLLKHGASLMVEDDQLRSPIHFAVEQGNLEMLSLLIDYHGTNQIHSKDAENQTPLHYAAYYGHYEILKKLLFYSWKIDSEDSSGRMAIHIAAEYGNHKCVALLAEENEVHALAVKDRNGRTALHLAVISQSYDTVQTCLNCTAVINFQDTKGNAAIHYALESEDTDILKSLIQNGADINLKGKHDNTPLMVAVYKQNFSAMKLLLDYEADVKLVDKDGNTFFDILLEIRNSDLVETIARHHRWKEVLQCKNQPHLYMERLIERCPETCEKFLDRFISYSDHHLGHHDLAVVYNYEYLVSEPVPLTFAMRNRRNYFGPDIMVEHKRENLLDHPVTRSLLNFKWNSFTRHIYNSLFLLYLLFIVSLTILMMIERKRNIKNAERAETAHKHNSTKYEYSLVFPPSAGGRALKALGIFVLTFGFFQMVKEVFQIIFKRLRYFADPTNYMEWSIYITAIVYMWKLISDERLAKNKFEFGIVSLFLGWINVLVFLKRVTFCKLFVIMFFNVCFTLTKVFLIFSVVFLAFILTFHQLFIKQNTFKTFGRTISKVIVMVSGEMDYEGFLTNSLGKRDSESNYRLVPFSTISYVVVVVFVLFMVIALMNLLIGLAVGDIETVRKTANLKMLEDQVDFIRDCEKFMPLSLLKKIHQTSETVYPNRKSWLDRIQERLIGFAHVDGGDSSDGKPKVMEPSNVNIFEDQLKRYKEIRGEEIRRLETMLHQQYELLQKLLSGSEGGPNLSSETKKND